LGAQDVYLDSGCGDGAAIIEYRTVFPQGASVVGISATCPNQEKISALIQKDEEDQKFSYCLCDFNNFPTSHLEGKVTLMTDILGALRYGGNPTRFIEQAGKLLKPGGKLYIRYAWSDGIEIPKDDRYIRMGGRPDSCQLFHLWFYSIRGFEVLEPQKTAEESHIFREKCLKEDDDIFELSRNKDKNIVVLLRNNDPVQADTLIADPRFAEGSEKDRNFDYWYPFYKWEMSDYTKSLIANKLRITLFE
jgi:SAM-dependent methyltransferase